MQWIKHNLPTKTLEISLNYLTSLQTWHTHLHCKKPKKTTTANRLVDNNGQIHPTFSVQRNMPVTYKHSGWSWSILWPNNSPPKQKKLFLPLVLDQQVFGISMYRESSIEINGPWQPLLTKPTSHWLPSSHDQRVCFRRFNWSQSQKKTTSKLPNLLPYNPSFFDCVPFWKKHV